MRDAMREHVGLARARTRDHKQRLGAFGVAGAVLDRKTLSVVEVGERRGANQGGQHRQRRQVSCFVRKGGVRSVRAPGLPFLSARPPLC